MSVFQSKQIKTIFMLGFIITNPFPNQLKNKSFVSLVRSYNPVVNTPGTVASSSTVTRRVLSEIAWVIIEETVMI